MAKWRRTWRDAGVSSTVGTLLMVALTLALSASVGAYVEAFGLRPDDASIALRQVATDGTFVRFSVESASPNLQWRALSIGVLHAPTRYGILVWSADCSAFAPSKSWGLPPTAACPVSPGDTITFAQGTPGTPLLLIADSSGVRLATLSVPPLLPQAANGQPVSSCSATTVSATLAAPLYSTALPTSAALHADDIIEGPSHPQKIQATLSGTTITNIVPGPSAGTRLGVVASQVWSQYGWPASATTTTCSS